MRNNKGFTLVELLAVIVILGLVIAIAVPAVSYYIDNSRRNIYINDANEYITIASQMIAKNDIVVRSTDTVYYIDISNLTTEKGNNSPWGEWVAAYVVVVIDDENNYEYYWTSVDDTGHKVDLTKQDELKVSSIYTSDDLSVSTDDVIGSRTQIVVDSDAATPSCTLEVLSGTLGTDGVYTSDVVIQFATMYAKERGATITGYGMGISSSANYNSKTTYTVSSNGTKTIYGYVKNSNGSTGKCSITITRKK